MFYENIIEVYISKYWTGTWVHGYGYYDPIPVPVLPDGYDISPFTYP
jgi:hypothetical protein